MREEGREEQGRRKMLSFVLGISENQLMAMADVRGTQTVTQLGPKFT